MVTSDFRPEVEICPFRACAMKNMQYNYMQYNRYYRNSSVIVDEADNTFRNSYTNQGRNHVFKVRGDEQPEAVRGKWCVGERVPLPLGCLLYTSPSPRDRTRSRMPSSA